MADRLKSMTNDEKERTVESRVQRYFDFFLGIAFFSVCVVIAVMGGRNWQLQVLLCLLGATVGWTAGFLAARHKDKPSKLTVTAAGMVTFGAGYVVAKSEPSLTRAFVAAISTDGELTLLRCCLCGVSLLIGFLYSRISDS